MLAVVDHQQQLPPSNSAHRPVDVVLAGCQRVTQRLQHHSRRRVPALITGARSTNHAPSANSGWSTAATCNASRVLPTPPGPVSVTTARVGHQPGDLLDRRGSRPTNGFGCTGRFPGELVDRPQRRELAFQLGVHNLEHPLRLAQIAQPMLAQIHAARPTRLAPAHSSPPTPRSARRAPRSSSAPHGSPRCRSSRRRAAPPHRCADPSAPATAHVTGHGSAAQRQLRVDRGVDGVVGACREHAWIPVTACVLTTWPPCASTASRRIASWRARAGRIASGCSSHSRVEPSRSVNKNVHRPRGHSATEPLPLPAALRRVSQFLRRASTLPRTDSNGVIPTCGLVRGSVEALRATDLLFAGLPGGEDRGGLPAGTVAFLAH